MEPYVAPWWLPGGHLQTIFAALAPAPQVTFSRERWQTPDGDFIDLDWAGTDGPLLALFHGLEGSSSSPYASAIAAAALARGWRCVVPHFRGCSGEINRLPRAYHSGDSAELDWILRRLKASAAIGISLGGNVLLKWLGETGSDAIVRKAASVSAPFDLAAAGRALDRGLCRLLYTRMFLETLRNKSIEKHGRHPGIFDLARARAATTLWEFDDTVTAPLHGFAGADDYWARASSGPWLHGIRIPTLVLNARNDPFMPATALDALQSRRDIPSNVTLEFTCTGGHVGFPGRDRWLARRVLEFVCTP